MDNAEIEKVVRRAELERALKSEGLTTSEERAARFIELNTVAVVPDRDYALATAECKYLYRDGYYIACIALCQAVAEALVRGHYVRTLKKKPSGFEYNVKKLRGKKNISPGCEQILNEIWQGKADYAYLNPLSLEDKTRLQTVAREKILALWKAESEILAL